MLNKKLRRLSKIVLRAFWLEEGKQEEFLNPIAKEEVPLDTHIDRLGPLSSTKKNCRYTYICYNR